MQATGQWIAYSSPLGFTVERSRRGVWQETFRISFDEREVDRFRIGLEKVRKRVAENRFRSSRVGFCYRLLLGRPKESSVEFFGCLCRKRAHVVRCDDTFFFVATTSSGSAYPIEFADLRMMSAALNAG